MDFDPNLFRKPDGAEGRELMDHMNVHHRPLVDWALDNLPADRKRILDIGCGGGMAIELLAKLYGDSHVTGIDHSKDAVEFSLARNEKLVREGRCDVLVASVSEMPFSERSFDLVTAFETYFFWPEPIEDIRKACELVDQDGVIAIVSEVRAKPGNEENVTEYDRVYGMNLLEDEKILGAMESRGLEATAIHHSNGDWVIYLGRRLQV